MVVSCTAPAHLASGRSYRQGTLLRTVLGWGEQPRDRARDGPRRGVSQRSAARRVALGAQPRVPGHRPAPCAALHRSEPHSTDVGACRPRIPLDSTSRAHW